MIGKATANIIDVIAVVKSIRLVGGCSPMKTKHARRGRAFDRMPSGVVMTTCLALQRCILFSERPNVFVFYFAAARILTMSVTASARFWPRFGRIPTACRSTSCAALRGFRRQNGCRLGRVLDVFDKKPPTFGGKWGAFGEKVWGFGGLPFAHLPNLGNAIVDLVDFFLFGI